MDESETKKTMPVMADGEEQAVHALAEAFAENRGRLLALAT